MNLYEKLNIRITKILNEDNVELNNIDNIIRQQLDYWKEDILDAISGSTDTTLADVAENNGYKLYDDSLVIDVKYRPNITLDLEELGITPDDVQLIIDDFFNFLQEDYDDIVAVGRSGGYWGFANATEQIDITEKGYNKLVVKIKEIIEDEFKEELDEAAGNEVEIAGVVDSALRSFTYDIAEVLLDDTALTFNVDLMNKMQSLKDRIDKQEEEMNKKSFWV